jgi:hypothetical protein
MKRRKIKKRGTRIGIRLGIGAGMVLGGAGLSAQDSNENNSRDTVSSAIIEKAYQETKKSTSKGRGIKISKKQSLGYSLPQDQQAIGRYTDQRSRISAFMYLRADPKANRRILSNNN